jgi:ApbE superfamily uncharacterized protein (UPF0280 family)
LSEDIQILPDGTVLLEYGPMRLFIRAYDHGKVMIDLAREGALKAQRTLHELARFLPVLKRKAQGIKTDETYPIVVQNMIDATKVMAEPDLTPMACVAGAASDAVADFMTLQGGTKIIVDNGGDIAIRLGVGEVAKVGIKTDISHGNPSYILSLDHTMGIGGVATSGLGGRSFTKGIASAVTVVSKTAALADAAATVIANATYLEDAAIQRALAESIYPDTDLLGEWVTVKVRTLPMEKVESSLNQGLQRANAIGRKGLIKGALIAVQGKVGWTDSLNSWLVKL